MLVSIDAIQTQLSRDAVKSEAAFEEMKKQGLSPRFIEDETIIKPVKEKNKFRKEQIIRVGKLNNNIVQIQKRRK